MGKRGTTQVRIVSEQPQSIVGSAEIIDLTKRVYNRKNFTQSWQLDAWRMYEEIGENTAAADFMGDSFANYRLFIGHRSADDPTQVVPFDDVLPEGFTDEQVNRAQDVLDSLNYPNGIEELQRMSGTNLFQVGEMWLLGKENDQGEEEWDIFSTEQISTTDAGKYAIKQLPSSDPEEINEDTDVLIRIWRRSPRFGALATSRIKALLTVLEELLLLTLEVRATTTSRVPAGMVVFPDSMEIVQTDGSSNDPETNGTASKMLQSFMDQFTKPIQQPGHAAAIVPWIGKANKDDIAAIRVIEFGRALSQEAMDQRKECIERFASAINLPAEIITGKGGLNHWGAWLIDEETQNENVSPLLKVFTNGLTKSYLLPRLELDMEEVPDFVIGFERATKIDDPEQIANDYEDYDRFLLSDEAMRRKRNINEDDAPTPDEITARIQRKAIVRETNPVNDIPATQVASAFKEERGKSLGLAARERELRIRLQVAADAAMDRALDKAGNRLRSIAKKDKDLKLRIDESGVSNKLIVKTFGKEIFETLNTHPVDLVNDSFDTYGDQWDQVVSKSQDQLINAMGLTGTQQQIARSKYDQAREHAKPLVVVALVALATRLIYDPAPDAPALGEFEEGMSISSGLIRNSLSMAGGASLAIDSLAQPGDPGGLYTADISQEIYQQSPHVEVSPGFTWVWGQSDRPFEPHQNLGGKEFSGDDDPDLANSDSFPDTEFYCIDDHDGCTCDTEPNINWVE